MKWEDLRSREISSELSQKLEAVNLNCALLVAGFDWAGDGYLFLVEHPGVLTNYNPCGYLCIGSGMQIAMTSLMFHSVNYEMSLSRVLYHVCEAKFMSEIAPGVGRKTHVKLAFNNGSMDALELAEESIDGFRLAWEQYGKPRVPDGFLEHIRERFNIR